MYSNNVNNNTILYKQCLFCSCKSNTKTEPKCSADMERQARSESYCGLMTAQEGPFRECIGRIPAEGHMDSCVMDVCAVSERSSITGRLDEKEKRQQMKEVSCDALVTMEMECRSVGVTVGSWRHKLQCGGFL